MTMNRRMNVLLSLLLCVSLGARPQNYQPTEENLKSRQEFRDAKFGIFLHWGLSFATLSSAFSCIGACMPCWLPVSGP